MNRYLLPLTYLEITRFAFAVLSGCILFGALAVLLLRVRLPGPLLPLEREMASWSRGARLALSALVLVASAASLLGALSLAYSIEPRTTLVLHSRLRTGLPSAKLTQRPEGRVLDLGRSMDELLAECAASSGTTAGGDCRDWTRRFDDGRTDPSVPDVRTELRRWLLTELPRHPPSEVPPPYRLVPPQEGMANGFGTSAVEAMELALVEYWSRRLNTGLLRVAPRPVQGTSSWALSKAALLASVPGLRVDLVDAQTDKTTKFSVLDIADGTYCPRTGDAELWLIVRGPWTSTEPLRIPVATRVGGQLQSAPADAERGCGEAVCLEGPVDSSSTESRVIIVRGKVPTADSSTRQHEYIARDPTRALTDGVALERRCADDESVVGHRGDVDDLIAVAASLPHETVTGADPTATAFVNDLIAADVAPPTFRRGAGYPMLLRLGPCEVGVARNAEGEALLTRLAGALAAHGGSAVVSLVARHAFDGAPTPFSWESLGYRAQAWTPDPAGLSGRAPVPFVRETGPLKNAPQVRPWSSAVLVKSTKDGSRVATVIRVPRVSSEPGSCFANQDRSTQLAVLRSVALAAAPQRRAIQTTSDEDQVGKEVGPLLAGPEIERLLAEEKAAPDRLALAGVALQTVLLLVLGALFRGARRSARRRSVR